MNRLQERRTALGLTQQDVAAHLRNADRRMDASMVSRFEQGVCIPTERVLSALESVLQADRSDLFDELALNGVPKDPRPERELTAVLANTIPHGKENAVDRAHLCGLLKMSDRDVRRAISEAREDGLVIVNSCDGRGYYQTEDIGDIRRQYAQEQRRMRTLYRTTKRMRDILKEAGEI